VHRVCAIAVIAAASSLAVAPHHASAQEVCPVDGGMQPLPSNYGQLADFFPSDQARGVPIDGFVRLRYVGIVPNPPVVIVTNMITGLRETGVTHVIDNEVHWQDDELLQMDTPYQVVVADPASGGGEPFTFTTGLAPSVPGPPVFQGVDPTSATFVRNGSSDLCGDPDAIEVTPAWHRAQNNGWPANDVEYVIFQTRGPGVSGPIERARQRGQSSGGSCSADLSEICRSFRIASQNATSGVCFNVQAMDAYGRADGNSVEACVHPEVGNFFAGCSAQRATAHHATPWLAGLIPGAIVVAFAIGSRARRRHGSRS
jgi:hypothetical protein